MKREKILAFYAADKAVAELIEELPSTVARLEARVAELEMENAALRAYVQALEQKLGQNSRNSRQPASRDGFARPASLRRASGLSPGGQQGHPGRTLRISEHPDRISVHDLHGVGGDHGRQVPDPGGAVADKDLSGGVEVAASGQFPFHPGGKCVVRSIRPLNPI